MTVSKTEKEIAKKRADLEKTLKEIQGPLSDVARILSKIGFSLEDKEVIDYLIIIMRMQQQTYLATQDFLGGSSRFK
ncbi:TPA: hypothetical protein U7M21_001979 [Streptococcus agalactiae]|nr:hypothetical protein [Streptococcus agalactiae]HEN7678150.1 hypothetical protein [Streptococcus agalactiae]